MGKVEIADPWEFERSVWDRGFHAVAGVDEAGRGPLAGPVVAAAVILPRQFDHRGIHDSKRLTERARQKAFERIRFEALAVGVGIVGPEVIDEINILRATCAAMRAALDDLGAAFDFVLVDGQSVSGFGVPTLPIVGGDGRSISIAAASVIAKVTRDQIMCELHATYPEYGFASHKGYGCRTHMDALDRYGPCPCHRRSFTPVNQRISQCKLGV